MMIILKTMIIRIKIKKRNNWTNEDVLVIMNWLKIINTLKISDAFISFFINDPIYEYILVEVYISLDDNCDLCC